MPIDPTLQHKSVPPYFPEPPRRRLLIATVTLIVALLGLALPAPWLGERSGGATSAAVRPAARSGVSADCTAVDIVPTRAPADVFRLP